MRYIKKAFYIYWKIAAVCSIFLLLGILSLNTMMVYNPDSARYLIWANSLARGEGYKDATSTEPASYVIHAPLLPLLLTPGAFLFPNNIVAAKAAILAMGCAAVFLFYRWLRKKTGENSALFGALFLAIHPLMMLYSTQILSDVPFIICIILFFHIAEKLPEKKAGWTAEAGLIAVIVSAVLLRDVGMILMAAAVFFYLWKKLYRRAVNIFLFSTFFYLLWYLRNEVIVAAAEDPPLRNITGFLGQLYTPPQAGLLTEFTARIWINLGIYIDYIGRLLLLPDYSTQSYMVISESDPFVSAFMTILPFVKYILIIVTLGFTALGILQLKKSKLFLLYLFFLVLYFCFILLYPVVDIRFLFPVFIIMAYLCITGIKEAIDRRRKILKTAIYRYGLALFFLLICSPNLIWLQSYILNSFQYARSAESFVKKLKEEKDPPQMLIKPIDLAGEWVVKHSDPSAVIMTRWKEAVFCLDGRKTAEGNPRMGLDQFHGQIRDYRVRYIIAVRWRSPINEFETLFARTDGYKFIPVHSIGNVVVYEVKSREHPYTEERISLPDSAIQLQYDKALEILEDEPLRSGQLLNEIAANSSDYSMTYFHSAVAKEFAGQFDSAITMFEQFRTHMQAASSVQQALSHIDLIYQLKAAESAETPVRKAGLFWRLAVRYWGAGFHKRAMQMLSRSLQADIKYLPSLITTVIYSLQKGDTASAWEHLAKARSLQPENIAVKKLDIIQKCSDTLKYSKIRSKQVRLRTEIIDAYISMGLHEYAIGELHSLLYIDPSNQYALRTLAELYSAKRRYEPARRCYISLLTLNPADIEVQRKLDELNARF